MEAVSGQRRTALPVHSVHVALPHAAGDGPSDHIQVTAMFTSRCDLMAQTVLTAHTDRIVLITVKRYCKRMSPRLLFANQVYVDILTDFLK